MGRKEYLLNQKKRGRRILGVFPAQYPREILWAFDVIPVEIWDPESETTDAGTHLQPYICSIVRSGLELILQGKSDIVDGFLFPHTCDSIQNLASLVNDCIRPQKPCYFFYHPKAPYGPHSREFYIRQLQLLVRVLENQFGSLDMDKLKSAVQMGHRVHRLVKKIYDLRAEGRLPVSNSEFYRILRLGEFFHPEDFHTELENLLSRTDLSHVDSKPSIVISGVLPHPIELLTALDDLGIRIGSDDYLSLSRRYIYQNEHKQFEDPFEDLAESYFSLPPCSTKSSGIRDRLDYLLGIIEKSGARGIVFYQIKYCETELFDVPLLVDELRKRNLKTLVMESELHEGFSGQMATRLEAFAEMLNSK